MLICLQEMVLPLIRYMGLINVLIDERATLNFFENNHQMVPMWAIFENLTMKVDSKFKGD